MCPCVSSLSRLVHLIFFFNDTTTPEIYTLSLHDALPICAPRSTAIPRRRPSSGGPGRAPAPRGSRSEEHTSELQSRRDLVCRLLLEKKKMRVNPGDIVRGDRVTPMVDASRHHGITFRLWV